MTTPATRGESEKKKKGDQPPEGEGEKSCAEEETRGYNRRGAKKRLEEKNILTNPNIQWGGGPGIKKKDEKIS